MTKTVNLMRDGAVGIIQLDRPGRYNSLDGQGLREMLDAVIELKNDDAIRAVLVTATGNVFCPGADVTWLTQGGDNIPLSLEDAVGYLHSTFSRLLRMPKPVITGVNGIAAGGGFSLAMTGDMVLAREDARFTAAYSRIGASPDGGLTFFLGRTLGLRRSMEMVFLNRELSAQEAMDWGLVTRVLPTEGFDEAVLQTAHELAAGPTMAFARARDLIYHAFNRHLEAQMERETQHIVGSAHTEDMRNGVRAFVEKRPPTYQGR